MGEGENTRVEELKGLQLGMVSQAEQIRGMLHLSWKLQLAPKKALPPSWPRNICKAWILASIKVNHN